ncbi:RNA binding protein [Salpingoeca rosetta]|uniref:RNA binding protein n=1 Tax=Salpingoeca rosetta (strain ATCC 50818 / BSB-021) TaxID=946362 RepID=F2UIN3_SALR5|nr:RNA binding protein [Salpingoeca rosetta]EGD77082.1 RNA binding protein [Salpingoeca rosetta]|eukprot:XP_004990921.1 RNA binding protein [Salpingoeca rosetta]
MSAVPNASPTRRDRDENNRKIFVGSLDPRTTREQLVDYFDKFGNIVDCVVMTDAQGTRSRGFGFVTFKEAASVEQVLASGPHEIAGRVIDPKRALPRHHHDDPHQQQQQQPQQHRQPRVRKVFLGGLPHDAKEEEIKDFFSKYGDVEDVIIQYDRISGRPRGFGFVVFENDATVDQLVTSSERVYVEFKGKRVEIKRAFPKESAPRSSTARQYQQQFTYRRAGEAYVPTAPMVRPNYRQPLTPFPQPPYPAAQQMMQRYYPSPYYPQFSPYAARPSFDQFPVQQQQVQQPQQQQQFYDPTMGQPVGMEMMPDDGMQPAQVQFPTAYDPTAPVAYMAPTMPMMAQTTAHTQPSHMAVPMQQAPPQLAPHPQGGVMPSMQHQQHFPYS